MRTPLWRGTSLGARWPLALLIISIGLTVVAVYESVRVAVSNQAVAESVVHDYAEIAGWAYERHLEQNLWEMAREVLNPINHGAGEHSSPMIPPAQALVHYLDTDPKCNCHRPRFGPPPETFIAFSIHADTLGFVVNTHPNPREGWEVDRTMAVPVPAGAFTAYAEGDRKTIVQSIRRQIHEVPDNEHGYTFIVLDLGVGKRMIAFALMPTSWGDTIVYGAQYTPAAIHGLLRDIMGESDLLPPSFATRTRDLLRVTVRDRDDHMIFATDRTSHPEEMTTRTKMGPRYANLVVEASLDPEHAGALIVGGVPASRVPFLLGALMLAGALTVTAVTVLRRESELSRVRAEWIASVSHELRTPLAQIRLFLDTVRLGRAPDEERRNWALAQVDRETTRLNHLIEKVLSFSRLGRGSEPDAQPCDITAETQKIVDEFRPIAETKQVTIVTELAKVPMIPLRKDALRHILLNLLDNAVKYGPAGQTVRVRVEQQAHTVSLSVADQGAGVAPSERESVWRQFSRGRASAEQGGSGIGLSIVRDLATQHGGRASVGTAPSGGALFTVTLPIPGRAA